MNRTLWILTIGALAGVAGAGGAARAAATGLSAQAVNKAAPGKNVPTGRVSPVLIRAQVLLDRSHVSPGVIDGYNGGNLKKALKVFQGRSQLSPSGKLDTSTWEALLRAGGEEPVLTSYSVQEADVKGPFVKAIPTDLKKKAKLTRLAYTSPQELLAEKFHMDVDLLQKLNPKADFKKAGTEITVANVRKDPPAEKVAKIVVSKQQQSLKAYDKAGKLIAFYPATVGSSDFPSPSGNLKVTAVAENPTFTHSSKLEYSKLKKGEVLKIAAGPNNPVGAVWIDLNKRGYGIHGTPEPAKISKSDSHGCVRLTNWDAKELAGMVSKGVPVSFSG